ncbi:ATP-binding protein [Pararhizobium sp. PWRC1-1]|uniref:ATP-binding protein n=1 Tax=Pararhizobium sp. PWRC1-1 TaxID=2804566 RepID=UPI003CEEDF48
MTEFASLIDADRRIGTITRLTAIMAEVTLPLALAATGRRGLSRGTVGDFVFIDCDLETILGRIVEVGIPGSDRTGLDRQIENQPIVHPDGKIQMLATVDKTSLKVTRGIMVQPRIGDSVYLAEGRSLSKTIQDALVGTIKNPILIELGQLAGLEDATISIPPEKLFGRHCGIFGATGGGKSWTLSRLVNEAVRLGGKCILLDPTGEFAGRIPGAKEFSFARAANGQELARFPYRNLAEEDLRALLTPTGQVQIPTLRNAVRTLRMVDVFSGPSSPFGSEIEDDRMKVDVTIGERKLGHIWVQQDGTIKKADTSRMVFGKAEIHLSQAVGSDVCDFNIHALPAQIRNECVYPAGNGGNFGILDPKTIGFCSSLIVRTETYLSAPELGCIFSENGADICAEIDKFVASPTDNAMILSFKDVTFKYNTRELLLNALGRYLLRKARTDMFKSRPVICFLDEAHQFIGQSVGDEANRVSLDSFGLIAKEGRKYGLTVTIATQRPRDVPQDVLSQLGTLIVHRLTNERDRETIEKACGDMDRSAAAFIPSLAQGEAIFVGPDLPAPMPIQMMIPPPSQQPQSAGPDYQTAWAVHSGLNAT